MSTFSATCDALIEDLLDNVPSLAVDPEATHRYTTWFPEELTNDGRRHLAVFPSADGFDIPDAVGAPLGAHFRTQVFTILVWEDASTESSRGTSDEESTAAFLDLYEDVLMRAYQWANVGMANSWRQWFAGAQVPERTATVRSFRISVQRMDTLAFT